MKRNDLILIIILSVLAITGYFVMSYITNASNTSDGTANVYYNDSLILRIYLEDGDYDIVDQSYVETISIDDEDGYFYQVSGKNGIVVIEYLNNQVRVVEETSPKNICQYQGLTSSPLYPLTCLPNKIIVIIRAKETNNPIDFVTG